MTSYRSFAFVSLAAVTAAFASPAIAQVKPGGISLSVDAGGSFAVGGTMHDGAIAPVSDLGILNPNLAGIPATLQIQRRGQNDVFDTAWSIGGELGYGLSETSEVLLSLRYMKASGNRINVGGAAAGAPVNATLPVFGNFGDYKALSVALGYKTYLGGGSGIKPFLAGRVGAARISAISADFTVPDANIALNGVPFSKASWVVTGGADLGVSIPVNAQFRIEPEVGIEYIDGAKGNDSALGGLGLGNINNKGTRWSMPVRVRLRVAM